MRGPEPGRRISLIPELVFSELVVSSNCPEDFKVEMQSLRASWGQGCAEHSTGILPVHPSCPRSGSIITPDVQMGKQAQSEGSHEVGLPRLVRPYSPNMYYSDAFLFIKEIPSFPSSLLYLLGTEKDTVITSGNSQFQQIDKNSSQSWG